VLIIGFLQPIEGFTFFPHANVGFRDTKGRDVVVFGYLRQAIQPALQDTFISEPFEIFVDRGCEFRASGKGQSFCSLSYRLLLFAHLRINFLQHPACRSKFWIGVEYFSKLLDGLFILAREVKLPAQAGVNKE